MSIGVYIDGANLHKGLKNQGLSVDYSRLRTWCIDKFGNSTLYMFLGYVSEYQNLYQNLVDCGYVLVFKEVTYDHSGNIKGNCDVDLVLQAVIHFFDKKHNGFVLVSSDGDYASMVRYLNHENVFVGIVSPAKEERCSILLKKIGVKMFFLNCEHPVFKIKKPPLRT